MTTLADQQQALLDALFSRPGPQDTAGEGSAPWFRGPRGLHAYRSNGHAQAERSLLATYPVLAQLLGDESFPLLARDFWHSHPPMLGDLAQWGDALAAFLAANAQLQDEPYLADVARVEWALHRCASAPDIPPDPASFALLAGTAPEALTLLLASGTAVVASSHPVASIVGAHLGPDPTLEEAGRRLRAGIAESACVWRHGLRPRVARCEASASTLLQALLGGASLAQALDQSPGFAFDQWLPQAVRDGLVLGARLTAA